MCTYVLLFFTVIFFLIIRRPPRATRTDTLFPYTTLFRSNAGSAWKRKWNIQEAYYTWNPLPHGSYNSTWTERSEEHTSELQSLMRISYAVFCLKKKINK